MAAKDVKAPLPGQVILGLCPLEPAADLTVGTTYTATIKGGTNGVKDAADNALASDKTWTFYRCHSDRHPAVHRKAVHSQCGGRRRCRAGRFAVELPGNQPGRVPAPAKDRRRLVRAKQGVRDGLEQRRRF